jgi:hypothetical protein
MRRRLSLFAVAAIVALAAVGAGSPAHATLVTYTTVGTFDSGDTPGTNVYTDAANGILITFNGIVSNSVDVPPTTQASLGEFDSTGTTATSLVAVSSGFTLDIFQTSPDGGAASFVGSLPGSLAFANSQAFLLFSGSLSATVVGSFITTYKIIEADDGITGRANIVSPSTNAGVSSVEASISISAVPEPSSLVMAGLGAFGLLGLAIRRKRRG